MEGEMTTCDDHADGPDNYVDWPRWAADMSKTHRQRRCDECNRWAIWEPKQETDA